MLLLARAFGKWRRRAMFGAASWKPKTLLWRLFVANQVGETGPDLRTPRRSGAESGTRNFGGEVRIGSTGGVVAEDDICRPGSASGSG
jgi:hypothetical protein